ncbi:MAG: D-sedoheptulose 7-phosphate isomerase [Leptospiraceae bacterium]|nr:D-sedoheptulose 7-phosphate isomerase [Leptospiraceae bacterium]MCP5503208.1 D-sedoheptulose 7-phosphate isomerase [Leptospiraceae bacterium]
MKDYIQKQFTDSIFTKQKAIEDKEILQTLQDISQKAIEVYKQKGKILIAGNGGSAADSQHIAGELISRFYFDRPGLAAIALNTDSSTLTAIGNDYGYEHVFARQIEANGNSGDIFIGISTSGNSKNIIRALSIAREKGLVTIGFTGESGGAMLELCDFCLKVPSRDTPRIQECHILFGHIICACIEKELFGN